MRSIFGSTFSAAVTAGALAASLAFPALAADAPKDTLGPDREEIIVTHSRLAPLSEWAQMQAHEAEYQRLKAKFEPGQGGANHVDTWASDRAAAQPAAPGTAFMQENADQPTPPAVQAIKDAVSPP